MTSASFTARSAVSAYTSIRDTFAGLVMTVEQIATLGTAAALLLWSHVGRLERKLRLQASRP